MLDFKYQKYYLLSFCLVGIIFLTLFNLKLNFEASVKKPAGKDLANTYSQGASKFALLLSQPTVLAANVTPSPTPKVSPKPTPIKTNKNSYIIAAVGDSMVETMGPALDYLAKELHRKYPQTNFSFYNYGVGGENVEAALSNFPPLANLKPDITIVGSFSYNPLFPYDPEKQKGLLSEFLNRVRQSSTKVYLLTEIAPLEDGFGTGVGGVNWPEDIADAHTLKIIEQLNNALSLAPSLGVGLIDAYNPSLKIHSYYARREYVDTHDGIHPSVAGQTLTAKIIANTISLP